MNKGTLYGVSVGPGDPELMTLKAQKCLNQCPVIAAPRTKSVNTMALDIVKQVVDISEKEILYLDFLMSSDAEKIKERHRQQAEDICAYLDSGKDVAMLNIGDVNLFGTFSYINEIVKEKGYKTASIAGVTSFCAVAATLNTSLTEMKKPLHIIPSSFGTVEECLDLEGSKILMKSASALPEVKRVIQQKGLSEKTSLVANCGLENERVYQNIDDSTNDEGYFVTILVKA